MSFVKHTWVNGELLTAVLMNRLEDAIDELSQSASYATDADCDELFEDFLQDDSE